jgi:nucleotide-binding universal stress UspA family protein
MSRGARRAVRVAVEVARPTHARVVLVFVAPKPARLDGHGADMYKPFDTMLDRTGASVLSDLTEHIHLPLDCVETRLEHGDPADELCRVAEATDADLIVIGSRGRGAVLRSLFGSTSYRVLQSATRPVVVVR